MVKLNKMISIDFPLAEEVKRRGLALSTLLNKLLSEHLQIISSPEAKLQEAKKLTTEAEKLQADVDSVFAKEQAEKERLLALAESDELKAEKERAKHEEQLQDELINIRNVHENKTNEQVEQDFKLAWDNRNNTPKAYRAAFSIYMAERGLR